MNSSYVQRPLEYRPNQWPPSSELAELHSRCTEPGLPNLKSQECPCCGQHIRIRERRWLSRRHEFDFAKCTALVAYLKILRVFIVVMLVVFLIGLFPIYTRYAFCAANGDSCIQEIFGVFVVVDYGVLVRQVDPHAQVGLDICNLVIFLLLQFTNLAIVIIMQITEAETSASELIRHHAVLLKNIPPDSTEKSVRAMVQHLTGVTDLAEVTILFAIRNFVQLQRQRNQLYFLARSYESDSISAKEFAEAEQKLVRADQLYNEECKADKRTSRAILLFRYFRDAKLVKAEFKLNAFNRFKLHWDKVFGAQNLQVYSSHVPLPHEILWQNMGEDSTERTMGRFKSTMVSVGVLLVMALIMGLAFIFRAKIEDQQKLKLGERMAIQLIAVLTFAVLSIYGEFIRKWSRKRLPTSYESESTFSVSMMMLFHELFYIVIPVALFYAPLDISHIIRLYYMDSTCRMFLLIQFLISVFDVCHLSWRCKKQKVLSDSRESSKLSQKSLNGLVGYPDFPLEFKMVIMFKIWSFALFYTFYSPFYSLFFFLILLFLYLRDKRALYLKYRVVRLIGVGIFRKFLNLYIAYFASFLLFVYCYGVSCSSLTLAIAVAVTLLIFISIFILEWQHLRRMKASISRELDQKPFQLIRKNAEDCLLNFQEQTYYDSYAKYVEGLEQHELDMEIEAYLQKVRQRNLGQSALVLGPRETELQNRKHSTVTV